MVEKGLLQPQPDVVALGGIALHGGGFSLGQSPGFARGGAGIKQQPVDGEADRPIPAVGGAIGKQAAAATITSTHVDIGNGGVRGAAATGGKQRQLRQEPCGCGLLLLGQGIPGGEDRLELGVVLVGRQQALLQIQGPACLQGDRIAGAGVDLRGQVEHHGQASAGHGPIRQGLDQVFLVAGFDGAPAQHIQPGYQASLLEIQGVLQDHEIVAHIGILNSHQLVSLLQLVVGLADL